jgi:hypothetical protein
VAAYLTVLAGAAFGLMPAWTLIGPLTPPLGIGVIMAARKFSDTVNYTPAKTRAIALSSVMGVLLIGA